MTKVLRFLGHDVRWRATLLASIARYWNERRPLDQIRDSGNHDRRRPGVPFRRPLARQRVGVCHRQLVILLPRPDVEEQLVTNPRRPWPVLLNPAGTG